METMNERRCFSQKEQKKKRYETKIFFSFFFLFSILPPFFLFRFDCFCSSGRCAFSMFGIRFNRGVTGFFFIIIIFIFVSFLLVRVREEEKVVDQWRRRVVTVATFDWSIFLRHLRRQPLAFSLPFFSLPVFFSTFFPNTHTHTDTQVVVVHDLIVWKCFVAGRTGQ